MALFSAASKPAEELYDLTMNAFDWGDYYRNPVLMLGDGILAQMADHAGQNPGHQKQANRQHDNYDSGRCVVEAKQRKYCLGNLDQQP